MSSLRFFVASFALVLAGCTAPDISPGEHAHDVEAWQEWRLNDLTREDSWLTLIDYHWMSSFPISIGASEGSDIVLPRGPALAGTFNPDGDEILFNPASSKVTADSIEVRKATKVLREDSTGVVFRLGEMSWLVRTFQDRPAVRVRDNAAALRTNFPGLDYFPVNPDWRLNARYEPYSPPKRFPVAIFTGGDDLEESPGRVIFEIDGETYSLDVTDTSDTGYFVIFSDETNGAETYPAGRYVWFDKPEGSDSGPVVLDFNKSYNPPCAFTEYATCPLPPRAHRIAARIEAGELTFKS